MNKRTAEKKHAARKSSNGKDSDAIIDVIVETPKGHRNKFKYDEQAGAFRLGSVLPAGSAFPYDFGFVPETKAADGDPLDVLLLMDEPAFPGCRVAARIIGVMEAEQGEGQKLIRNDRIMAVAEDAHDYADLRSVSDLNENLLQELQRFFISYNETRGKTFRLLKVRGPKAALKLIRSVRQSRTKKRVS